MDVVRPPGVAVIGPRVGAGPDRQEPVAAVRVGEYPARAVEVRIERRVVLSGRMVVASGRVGLPDLDHRVGHRSPVLVGDPAGNDDALAESRFVAGLAEVGERGKMAGGEAVSDPSSGPPPWRLPFVTRFSSVGKKRLGPPANPPVPPPTHVPWRQ